MISLTSARLTSRLAAQWEHAALAEEPRAGACCGARGTPARAFSPSKCGFCWPRPPLRLLRDPRCADLPDVQMHLAARVRLPLPPSSCREAPSPEGAASGGGTGRLGVLGVEAAQCFAVPPVCLWESWPAKLRGSNQHGGCLCLGGA